MPKLILTSVVRGSQQGESHGGIYTVDFEHQQGEQHVDWNTSDIDFEGRGADRGLRGIAFDDDEVYIAASDELFCYDQSFAIQNSYKNRYLKKSSPLSKIVYDKKIHVINNALGLHSYVSRVQGSKLKSKNEIRIATTFQKAPEEFLSMIVVHELAHLKEKDHNKNFYQLCQHMLPNYHQLEFDMRVYLTQIEALGHIY